MFDLIIQNYLRTLEQLLSNKKLSFDKHLHGNLPKHPGVYRITNNHDTDTDTTIYIGTSNMIYERIYSNLYMGDAGAHSLRRKFLKHNICKHDQDI